MAGPNRSTVKIAGADPDYHRRDLFNSIRDGEFPSWTLKVQIMPFDEAADYRFNPFDLTKVWPHSDYPLHEVGKLTLNRNATDFHTEIEQAAFQPNNLVPGIGLSPDKMLLGRVFAYADAHRARIGGNYMQIPVNRPQAEVNSYSKDGAMRMENVSDPVYAPNSKGGPAADATRAALVPYLARVSQEWSAERLPPAFAHALLEGLRQLAGRSAEPKARELLVAIARSYADAPPSQRAADRQLAAAWANCLTLAALARPIPTVPGGDALADPAVALTQLGSCGAGILPDHLAQGVAIEAVSYTHLTLPTSDLV